MKRRDAIKLGSALLGGACIASLPGCTPNENISTSESVDKFVKIEENNFSITPKQTAMYEYSYPMIFSKDAIDELYKLNKTLKKGKITTLYSSIPSPLADKIHPYFAANTRGENENIKTLDDYISFVKYATKKGFKCLYALNSPMPIPDYEAPKLFPKLFDLFNKLQNAGINDVKIANPALLEVFTRKFPDINLHLSTSSEYHTLQNYEYIIKTYPKIKSINITTDENKNFKLLYNLRKLYPKVKLELLVNEYCVKYCIARCYHPVTNDMGFPCFDKYIKPYQYLQLAKNNLVYPWEWEYYSAIGVNNFKFTAAVRSTIHELIYIKEWLKLKENGIENYLANDFINSTAISGWCLLKFSDTYKLSELIKELPDINHFIKNGSNCASSCGSNCRYCYDIADKLKKMQV